MSTKNLARTVIEGGRTNYAKYVRRFSSRELRVANRRYCKKVLEDLERWYVKEEPRRGQTRLWRDEIHADKVSPCGRFLASRADRPWDAVHSEICARFDRRKLAGMHVTKDHLLSAVVDLRKGDPYPQGRYWVPRDIPRFSIDENGIFRFNPRARY